MSLEKMGQSIESNEVKVRLQATPEDIEEVEENEKYSNSKIVLSILKLNIFFSYKNF